MSPGPAGFSLSCSGKKLPTSGWREQTGDRNPEGSRGGSRVTAIAAAAERRRREPQGAAPAGGGGWSRPFRWGREGPGASLVPGASRSDCLCEAQGGRSCPGAPAVLSTDQTAVRFLEQTLSRSVHTVGPSSAGQGSVWMSQLSKASRTGVVARSPSMHLQARGPARPWSRRVRLAHRQAPEETAGVDARPHVRLGTWAGEGLPQPLRASGRRPVRPPTRGCRRQSHQQGCGHHGPNAQPHCARGFHFASGVREPMLHLRFLH